MKHKLKLLFGNREKGNYEDKAYIDPVDQETKKLLANRSKEDGGGKEYIELTVKDRPGLLSLVVIRRILELYQLFGESDTIREKATEEWEEIEILIGIKNYLDYLKKEEGAEDLYKHLRQIAKNNKKALKELKQVLSKGES